MGKNQRHKKILKSEKSKVKLKAKTTSKTKILPKGLNVTDVNFKIKPIIVLEQLKVKTIEEALSRRKLNLKELLTRLNHFNANVKYEACEGISQIGTTTLAQNLYTVLQGVGKLVYDESQKVRNKATILIADILSNVPNVAMPPFFDILTSYVTCAMTHIHKDIQADSLLFIDVLLNHTPELFVKNFSKIFVNFLTLISKQKSDSKLARTLTLNLDNNITTTKWRIKVLSRLNRILKVVVNQSRNDTENGVNHFKVIRAEDVVNSIPINKPMQEFPASLSEFCNVQDENSDAQSLQLRYIDILIPLLYETWTEVVPLNELKYMENNSTIIKQDAASILNCISEIFYLLWKLGQSEMKANRNMMKQLFLIKNNKLLDHFLKQFPYYQKDVWKAKRNSSLTSLLEANYDAKCIKENLYICYMFTVLYRSLPTAFYVEKAEVVVSYLNKLLLHRNYVAPDNIEMLALVLRIILFDNYTTWHQKNVKVEELINNVVHFHNNMENAKAKIEVFNLLCDMVHLPQTHKSDKYQNWLTTLPLLLCSPQVSEKVVDMLLLLAKQGNIPFQTALLQHLPGIIGNLKSTESQDGSVPVYVKIISMFYYIPVLKQQHLRSFELNQDAKIKKCIRVILRERSRLQKLSNPR